MTGIAHASIGAALGGIIKNPRKAFAAGVLSHMIADAIPHKDLPPIVEAPLLIAAMSAIALRYGMNSSQFWGALGAVLPDFEHALAVSGIIRLENEVFPTHLDYGKWHGRETNGRMSQFALILIAALIADRA